MRVTVIIVSFNTRALTMACLASLYEHAPNSSFEVIVLDNNSTDGSADAIVAQFPHVTLLRETTNHGFGRGNNIAAHRAGGEFLLLLNPDTLVTAGAIDALLAFAKSQPQAGIWGGRTIFDNGLPNPTSFWAKPSIWSIVCQAVGLTAVFRRSQIFNREALGGRRLRAALTVDIVSGCFFLIRRTLWQRLGGFEPAFFMYGEEADLCLRARSLGVRPMVTPDATIVHHGGASEVARSQKMVRLFKAKSMLMERHWPNWQTLVGKRLLTIWALVRLLVFGVSRVVRPSLSKQYNTWRAIWLSRSEWQVRSVSFTDNGCPCTTVANTGA